MGTGKGWKSILVFWFSKQLWLWHSFQFQIGLYSDFLFHFDHVGRLVIVDVTILNIDFMFISVYAPNDSRERKLFFSGLSQCLVCDKFVCLDGDFNCEENIHLDKSGRNLAFGTQIADQLSILKQDFFLLDPFREKYPNLQEFTWIVDNTTGIKSRLDIFYVSDSLFEFVESKTHSKQYF